MARSSVLRRSDRPRSVRGDSLNTVVAIIGGGTFHERDRLYKLGLRFTVRDALPSRRRAVHTALQTVRAVTVEASSREEAEAQVDQVRVALEDSADREAFLIDSRA